ncbi:MAG: hypothetical protein KF860_15480 [Cyclobacteriaceae bacterium]|nr:hypothetical protein [Cyclobacteriaceae bacterium]
MGIALAGISILFDPYLFDLTAQEAQDEKLQYLNITLVGLVVLFQTPVLKTSIYFYPLIITQ